MTQVGRYHRKKTNIREEIIKLIKKSSFIKKIHIHNSIYYGDLLQAYPKRTFILNNLKTYRNKYIGIPIIKLST